MLISIIIPVFNEEDRISILLERLSFHPEIEIIVVDGGSADNTVREAGKFNVLVLSSRKGRAFQMNAGGESASGGVLLFLHADTILPDNFCEIIVNVLSGNGRYSAGRFDLKFDNNAFIYSVISFLINNRSHLTGIFTGDQAMFIKKSLWKKMGGFNEIPIMEDVDFALRLKRECRVFRARERVITSARRWEESGIAKTIFTMWLLKLLFYMGVKPAKLAEIYKDIR